MSNIQPYSGASGLVPTRVARQLARVNGGAAIESALLNAKADVELTKLEAIGAIAAMAQTQVAQLSRMETTLAQMVPEASGRIAAIGDVAAISMCEVVSNASRKISR